MSIPTPHIEARLGEFGKTVLMPGDPLRAKFIAENYLKDAVKINGVRGINGYTGSYGDKKVSVMASGMGMPSMGIYAYELFSFYGVENIIRIGSAGGLSEKLKLRDIVLAIGACTDSNFASQYKLPGTFAPVADFSLLCAAKKQAEEMGIPFEVGNVLSSDVFYAEQEDLKKWADMGVLAVEMEAAALYMTAAKLKKSALCIATISDMIFTGERLAAKERETSFGEMMTLALKIAK